MTELLIAIALWCGEQNVRYYKHIKETDPAVVCRKHLMNCLLTATLDKGTPGWKLKGTEQNRAECFAAQEFK